MPKTREQLVSELADLIITSVNLRHKKKEDITATTTLMQAGTEASTASPAETLALDSLDILELVVSLEQTYKVKIAGPEQGRTILQTVGTLADFLHEQNV